MHGKIRFRYKIAISILALIGLAISILLITHNVSQKITPEDERFIEIILEESGYQPPPSPLPDDFNQQIDIIVAVQNASFHAAPETKLIPMGSPREPKNLYETKTAYCSDRARFIEKALRLYGFDTRFASLYEETPDKSFLQTIITKKADGVRSHAVVEVKTAKGWLMVDTRTRWISLDQDGNPRSLKELQDFAASKSWPVWSGISQEDMYFLLTGNFYIIYGLYSRHGRFYPPYTPYVPDINLTQFLNNFTL